MLELYQRCYLYLSILRPFGLSLIRHFGASLFNVLNYFVWQMTDVIPIDRPMSTKTILLLDIFVNNLNM